MDAPFDAETDRAVRRGAKDAGNRPPPRRLVTGHVCSDYTRGPWTSYEGRMRKYELKSGTSGAAIA
jgi:hypothetical protein